MKNENQITFHAKNRQAHLLLLVKWVQDNIKDWMDMCNAYEEFP